MPADWRLEDLIGKRIVDARGDEPLLLTFDDGQTVAIEGMGYDGLWQSVFLFTPSQKEIDDAR